MTSESARPKTTRLGVEVPDEGLDMMRMREEEEEEEEEVWLCF